MNDMSRQTSSTGLTDSIRIGPFVLAGRAFVIESNVEQLTVELSNQLRDLRVAADDVGGTAAPPPMVFQIGPEGPEWLWHRWGVWCDGESCGPTVVYEYVGSVVLTRLTKVVARSSRPLVPLHAAAVARDGQAIVLAGPSRSGRTTLAGWLTAHGWSYLSSGLTLLEERPDGPPFVHPFWRPLGVGLPSPLGELVLLPTTNTITTSPILVPASELGPLAAATQLAAIVLPRYEEGGIRTLEPARPAAAISELGRLLPELGADARDAFRTIVAVAGGIPAYSLQVDELPTAATMLFDLIGGSP